MNGLIMLIFWFAAVGLLKNLLFGVNEMLVGLFQIAFWTAILLLTTLFFYSFGVWNSRLGLRWPP